MKETLALVSVGVKRIGMKDSIYLIATRSGVARMTKRRPNLTHDEIGVCMQISIPDGVFRSPLLAVSLEVGEQAVIHPTMEIIVIGAGQSADDGCDVAPPNDDRMAQQSLPG